jgi:UDP-4-amino-4,6-dideoxy-N-acetyl-beta-L-altrosamine transaminase
MCPNIPYGKQFIDEKDIEAVKNVLKSDWLTTGPKVDEFENSIAKYIGCQYATVVNSGTSALDIAVQTLKLRNGSEIITTPFTFAATSNAIVYNNLIPVFADIKENTRNIDPKDIKRKISNKTAAIIYVDYAGHPCDIDEIKEIAYENDLFLIEDASHAIGSEYNNRKIGNYADMTIFSFHPVKNMTTGEGGAVVTNNNEFDKSLKILRNHGINTDLHKRQSKNDYMYDIGELGHNYRITDFQCALGISQLKKLDSFISKRNRLVDLYTKLLENIDFVETPSKWGNVKNSWHIYTILLDKRIDRDDFFKYMKSNSIGVNVHYIPIYRFSYYKNNYNFDPLDYPVTESVFRSIVTLPLYPHLKEEQIEYICEKIRNYTVFIGENNEQN